MEEGEAVSALADALEEVAKEVALTLCLVEAFGYKKNV